MTRVFFHASAYLASALLCASVIACAEERPAAPSTRGRDDDGGSRSDPFSDRATGPPGMGGEIPGPTITLPYGAAPVAEELRARAEARALDVHFSVDATRSFSGEIEAMQRTLEDDVIPALRRRVDDVAIGVSRFGDFPIEPFGTREDSPYELLTPITDDRGDVGEAIEQLGRSLARGGDEREAGAESLWQLATGEGLVVDGETLIEPAEVVRGRLGGAAFRPDALHVVVRVTDADTHSPRSYGAHVPGTHGLGDATRALAALPARLIGIASHPAARPHLEHLAFGTGAVVPPDDGTCATGIGGAAREPREEGCPLVFDVAPDGSGLADTVVDAMLELLEGAAFDRVFALAVQDPHDFVQAIEAVSAYHPDAEDPLRRDLHPAGDGIEDTFEDVRPGARLRFRIHLQNRSVRPAGGAQRFPLRIRVVGDAAVLLEHELWARVPGADAGAGLDAGARDASPSRNDAGPIIRR